MWGALGPMGIQDRRHPCLLPHRRGWGLQGTDSLPFGPGRLIVVTRTNSLIPIVSFKPVQLISRPCTGRFQAQTPGRCFTRFGVPREWVFAISFWRSRHLTTPCGIFCFRHLVTVPHRWCKDVIQFLTQCSLHICHHELTIHELASSPNSFRKPTKCSGTPTRPPSH